MDHPNRGRQNRPRARGGHKGSRAGARGQKVQLQDSLIATLFRPGEPFRQGEARSAPRDVARAFAMKLTKLGPCAACILEVESGGRLRLDHSRASLGRLEEWLLETLVLVQTNTKARAMRDARTKAERDRIELIVEDSDFLRLDERSEAIAVFVGLYFFKCLEKKGCRYTWHFETKRRGNLNQLVIRERRIAVVDFGVNRSSRVALQLENNALQTSFDWHIDCALSK